MSISVVGCCPFAFANNVLGLCEVCEALACAVGQIAPNPCYRLARLIKREF